MSGSIDILFNKKNPTAWRWPRGSCSLEIFPSALLYRCTTMRFTHWSYQQPIPRSQSPRIICTPPAMPFFCPSPVEERLSVSEQTANTDGTSRWQTSRRIKTIWSVQIKRLSRVLLPVVWWTSLYNPQPPATHHHEITACLFFPYIVKQHNQIISWEK